jgi:hypothetical protein
VCGTCNAHREVRNPFNILDRKSEWWRQLGDLDVDGSTGSEGVDWIHVVQCWL